MCESESEKRKGGRERERKTNRLERRDTDAPQMHLKDNKGHNNIDFSLFNT